MSHRRSIEKKPGAIPAEIAVAREKIYQQLRAVATESPFTQELVQVAPTFIKERFDGFDLPFNPADIPLTFFITPDQIAAVETILDTTLDGYRGSFYPTFGCIIVVLSDNPIIDTHTYLHEVMHQLGKNEVWMIDQQPQILRVGHSFRSNILGREIETGDFLEEATADWLATKIAARLLRSQGLELPPEGEGAERLIAKLSGGETYAHLRDCLMFLAKDLPDLFTLLIQARFEPKLLNQLSRLASYYYGPGTLRELNHLDSADPLTCDEVITEIKANLRPSLAFA